MIVKIPYLKPTLTPHEQVELLFISHFFNTYQESRPPVWIIIEILTFGNISWLYNQFSTNLQKIIAGDFGVDHTILVSWLRALTELRNTCAHHSRLWNKVFVNYPKIRRADQTFPLIPAMENRLGSFIPLILQLLNITGEKPGWNTACLELLTNNSLIRSSDLGLQKWWGI